MATVKAALQAKEIAKEILKGLPGVNGIGITWDDRGQPCVRVNVESEITEESRKKIPASVEGVPVLVQRINAIRTENLARFTSER
ncbi:MAG: hypothetical protein ACREDR_45950 [Blastocatellia bacterium]